MGDNKKGAVNNFKKYRNFRKIDQITPELKEKLDAKLSDTGNTYKDITKWLNDELKKQKIMFDDEPLTISLSAIGRYALRTKQMAARYMETLEHLREVIKIAKENPEDNLNEGALQMSMMKLTEKLSMADFDDISEAKAIELVATISRTKAYKDKVYASLKSDVEKGYDLFMKRVKSELQAHPTLLAQIEAIADDVFGKILQ